MKNGLKKSGMSFTKIGKYDREDWDKIFIDLIISES